MDVTRYNKAIFEVIKQWFNAVAIKFQEYGYAAENVWNMDELEFGIGESQNTKVLVFIGSQFKIKRTIGK